MSRIRALTTALKVAITLLMATNVSQAQMVGGIGDPSWIAGYDSPTTQTIRLEWLAPDAISPRVDGWNLDLYENLYDAGNGVWIQELGQVTYPKWRTIYQDPKSGVTYVGELGAEINVEVNLDKMTTTTLQNPFHIWREGDQVKLQSVWHSEKTWNYDVTKITSNRDFDLSPSDVATTVTATDQTWDFTGLDGTDPMPHGWYSGAAGNATAAVNSDAFNNGTLTPMQGLCMTVAPSGNNFVGWVSPYGAIPLMADVVYVVEAAMANDNTIADAQALLDFSFQNFNGPDRRGTIYGSEFIYLDKPGQASAIGPLGTTYKMVFAPAPFRTDPWNGRDPNVVGMFDPSYDADNDMIVVMRLLDLDAGSFNAQGDFGTTCLRSLTVRAVPYAALTATPIWEPTLLSNWPFGTGYFAAQTNTQFAEQMGSAYIDNATQTAHYQLTSSGPGARKTLIPYDTISPNLSLNARLYPIMWNPNKVLMAEYWVSSPQDGLDPVDVIGVGFDTPTTELIGVHYGVVGSLPDNMHKVSSATASPQPFTGFIQTHQPSLLSALSQLYTDAYGSSALLRPFLDVINVPEINPAGSGLDEVVVQLPTVYEIEGLDAYAAQPGSFSGLDPIGN